jgi:hypothetical protein
VVKPQPEADQVLRTITGSADFVYGMDETPLIPFPAARRIRWDCPYGQPGDRLWVRESWAQRGTWRIPAWPEADADDAYWSGTEEVIYTADAVKPVTGWRGRPSIHMPRWASRILLEIVSVRVERLQDIKGKDAGAEGAPRYACDGPHCPSGENGCNARGCAGAREWYEDLWNQINGAGSWAANPWVWVVDFRQMAADQTEAEQG